jgi:hypothetical protein
MASPLSLSIALALFAVCVLSLPERGVQFDGSVLLPSPPAVVPEGFDFSFSWGTFLVSSISYGKLYLLTSVDAGMNGTLTEFADGVGRGMESFAGVQVDCLRELVYVAFSGSSSLDSPVGGIAVYSELDFDFIRLFNFTTLYDESLPKLVNDVTQDRFGNLYATDSYNGNVYAASPFTGEVSLLVHSTLLGPQDIGIGANGIEYFVGSDGAEYLLVAVSSASTATSNIYRIPIASPYSFTRVIIQNPKNLEDPWSFDGIKLADGGQTLYVVGNFNGKVYEFVSSDDWATCALQAVVNSSHPNPASICINAYDNQVYINSNPLSEAGAFTDGPYYIQSVDGLSRVVETLDCSAGHRWNVLPMVTALLAVFWIQA